MNNEPLSNAQQEALGTNLDINLRALVQGLASLGDIPKDMKTEVKHEKLRLLFLGCQAVTENIKVQLALCQAPKSALVVPK